MRARNEVDEVDRQNNEMRKGAKRGLRDRVPRRANGAQWRLTRVSLSCSTRSAGLHAAAMAALQRKGRRLGQGSFSQTTRVTNRNGMTELGARLCAVIIECLFIIGLTLRAC